MDDNKGAKLANEISNIFEAEGLSVIDGMHILLLLLSSSAVYFQIPEKTMQDMLDMYMQYFSSVDKAVLEKIHAKRKNPLDVN